MPPATNAARAIVAITLLAGGCAAQTTTSSRATTSRANTPSHLTADQVRAGIASGLPAFDRCWDEATSGRVEVPITRLRVTVLITPDGAVESAAVEGEDPLGVATCIEARARALRFPAAAEELRTIWPMEFRGR